jgi:hypothetical protein
MGHPEEEPSGELAVLLGHLEALNEEVSGLMRMAEQCERDHGLGGRLPTAAATRGGGPLTARHRDEIPSPSPSIVTGGHAPSPRGGLQSPSSHSPVAVEPSSSPFKGAKATVYSPVIMQTTDSGDSDDTKRARLGFDSEPATPLTRPWAGFSGASCLSADGGEESPVSRASAARRRGRPANQTMEVALSGGTVSQPTVKTGGSPSRKDAAGGGPGVGSFRFGTSYSLSPQRPGMLGR